MLFRSGQSLTGLLDEAADFARRRPVATAIGVAAAAFVVMRMLRASAAAAPAKATASPQRAARTQTAAAKKPTRSAKPAVRRAAATAKS